MGLTRLTSTSAYPAIHVGHPAGISPRSYCEMCMDAATLVHAVALNLASGLTG